MSCIDSALLHCRANEVTLLEDKHMQCLKICTYFRFSGKALCQVSCCVLHAVLSLCCGLENSFDFCSCAVTILILTLLSFVRVDCRSDGGGVHFTLTLSDSSRNMGNSNNKGHIVGGGHGGFSQAENRQFRKMASGLRPTEL